MDRNLEVLLDELTDELIIYKNKVADLETEKQIFKESAKSQQDIAANYRALYYATAAELEELQKQRMPSNVVPLINGFANMPDAG